MKNFLLIICIICVGSAKSQSLYFPNGNELNLHTNTNYLYAETKIYFKTRNSLVEHYRFEKVVDSLDQRWEYSGCFNGDCKIELLNSGDFNPEFGDNDTTGFIAFHVDTKDLDGGMKLAYKVTHKTNPTIFSTMVFNIIFAKTTTGIGSIYSKEKPNLTQINSHTFLVEPILPTSINITDLSGKILFVKYFEVAEKINLEQLSSGIYLANLEVGNYKFTQKLMIK